MAEKRQSSKEKPGQKPTDSISDKVGSDRAADRNVGGKLDFGIPADRAQAPQPIGGRNKGPEQGTGPMRSGASGVRDNGVGHAPGNPGAGSGGDLDADVIGLDGRGGLSARPASGRTQGPDITEGGSGAFASGPPAEGVHELPAGTHGAPSEVVHGSTVDRSGGDASTTGPETGADTTLSTGYRSQVRPDAGASADQEHEEPVPDNAAAGEISSGEAGGQ